MGERVEGESSICAHNVKWSYDVGELERTVDLIERLEEEAENRAKEMINQGYFSGELNCVVYINNRDIEVRGWWEIE